MLCICTWLLCTDSYLCGFYTFHPICTAEANFTSVTLTSNFVSVLYVHTVCTFILKYIFIQKYLAIVLTEPTGSQQIMFWHPFYWFYITNPLRRALHHPPAQFYCRFRPSDVGRTANTMMVQPSACQHSSLLQVPCQTEFSLWQTLIGPCSVALSKWMIRSAQLWDNFIQKLRCSLFHT